MNSYASLVFAALVNGALALIPARMARKRGYSFGGFWCLSFFLSFLTGTIVAACLPARKRRGESPGESFEEPAGEPAREEAQWTEIRNVPAFIGKYLGFVLPVVYCGALLILGAFSPGFYKPQNWLNILMQFAPAGMIALGAAASSRLRGPDVSMGSMAALASMLVVSAANEGGLLWGLTAAVLVCGILGLASGALIAFFRAPALAVTMITGALLRGLALTISEGRSLQFERDGANPDPRNLLYYIVPLLLCAGIALAALLLTGRLPRSKRWSGPAGKRNAAMMLGYGFTAMIAGLAGFAMTLRVQAAAPTIGIGSEILILFVFATVMSSRLLDNNYAALVYALAAALLWTLGGNVLSMRGVSSFYQSVVQASWALTMLLAACAARGGVRLALVRYGPVRQSLFGVDE